MLTNKFTIVIPTYGRQKYVLRAIKYWDHLGVQTVIMDGSKDPIPVTQLSDYNHCRYFHEQTSFLERLKKAIELVNTPFVSLIPDDEFYISSTLDKCIHILETENVESCGGQCLKFSRTKNEIEYSSIYKKLGNYNFLEDDGIVRMKRHMLDYTPSTLYSVMKTETWKKCMALMTKRIIDVYALLEIQFEMAATFHGKTMVLPEVLWLRSYENTPVRNEPGMYANKVFSKWWPDRSKSKEHEIVINDMLDNFQSPRYTMEEIKQGIEDTFNNIVIFQNKAEGGLSNKLALKYPKTIAKLNQIRNFIIPKSNTYSISNIHLIDDGTTLIIPQKEMESIYNIIYNFHFSKK